MASGTLDEAAQKKIALDHFLDAWDRSCDAGVSADLLAEVLIYLALTDLVADRGEEWVAEVIEDLPDRIRGREFTIERDGNGDDEA